MAYPPTSAFALLSVVMTVPLRDRDAVHTHGVSMPSDPIAALADTADLWDDTLATFTCTSWKTSGFALKQGPSDLGPTFEVSTIRSGTLNENPTPPNTALLARKQVTGVSGRRWGRFFVPGLNEAQVADGGSLTGPYFTSAAVAVNNWFEGLAAIYGGVFVYPNDSSDPRPVESYDAQSLVATQRRRLRS